MSYERKPKFFHCLFFIHVSWGGDDHDGLDEKRILLRSLPNEHISSSYHRDFWVSSPIVQQLSLSMC
jgi:hypothetical protein